MNEIDKLIQLFREFPGIGPRQAERFVYFLLTKNEVYRHLLAEEITNLKTSIHLCTSCFRFFSGKNEVCHICTNPHRDETQLMIVAKDVDYQAIEKTKTYTGYYFILGGTVPILDKNPNERVRTQELLNKVKMRAEKGLKEIIIALSINPEGEHTKDYIEGELREICATHGIKITTLGRGLSTGTELEYSDSETLRNALSNRKVEYGQSSS